MKIVKSLYKISTQLIINFNIFGLKIKIKKIIIYWINESKYL